MTTPLPVAYELVLQCRGRGFDTVQQPASVVAAQLGNPPIQCAGSALHCCRETMVFIARYYIILLSGIIYDGNLNSMFYNSKQQWKPPISKIRGKKEEKIQLARA
jgi:hypothetical protein